MISVDETLKRFSGVASGDDSCFWSRAGRAYRDGLARMWEETRGAATELELQPFTSRLIDADPGDVRAHWAIIGHDVRCCSNSLTESSWKALFDLGQFAAGWLVEYHYWVQITSGVQTAPLLADLLRRHRLLDAVRPALMELRAQHPNWADWVNAVRPHA